MTFIHRFIFKLSELKLFFSELWLLDLLLLKTPALGPDWLADLICAEAVSVLCGRFKAFEHPAKTSSILVKSDWLMCLKETPPSFGYSEAPPAARCEGWRRLAAVICQRFSFEVKMRHHTNILHPSAVILCWSWIYRKQTEAARSNFLIAGNTRTNQFRNHYSITGWEQTQACVTPKKQKNWTITGSSKKHPFCLSHSFIFS